MSLSQWLNDTFLFPISLSFSQFSSHYLTPKRQFHFFCLIISAMQIASMYDTLLELPLFKGVSREKISEIAGKSKFHFLKFKPDEEIVRVGDICDSITFVVSGAVRTLMLNPDTLISVSQTLYGPDVIMPDFMFGRVTNYPCTVRAITNVSILQVEKSDYMNILATDPIFLLNYVNYLSMNAQKAVDGTLALMSGDLQHRIAYWIIALSQPSSKSIVLERGKITLAEVFGVSHNVFYETINAMRDNELLEYDEEKDAIQVVKRRALLDIIFPPEK